MRIDRPPSSYRSLMPRDGAIIFGDLVGKLRILRLDCPKCGHWGQYLVDRLVTQYGPDTELLEWMEGRLIDCPRMQSHNPDDPCEAVLPDLSKIRL
jgi:hypothetical protein